MNLIKHVLKLIRIDTSIIAAFISGIICYRVGSVGNALFVFASTFFTITYGFSLNEVIDAKKDEVEPDGHVIACKLMSRRQGAIISAILFICSIVSASHLSTFQAGLSLLALIILSLYSYINNKYGIIANALVSICSGISILIGQKQFDLNIVAISGLSVFFFIFSREIILDIHDIKADRSIRKKSLPIVLSVNEAFIIAIIFSILSLVNCIVVGIIYSRWLYIAIMVIAHIVYFRYLNRYRNKKEAYTYNQFVTYSRLSFLLLIPALLMEL
jgi:4-hydroxybenzoate polyprenyltransferase